MLQADQGWGSWAPREGAEAGLQQGSSTLALVTFGEAHSLFLEDALATVGRSAASLASGH